MPRHTGRSEAGDFGSKGKACRLDQWHYGWHHLGDLPGGSVESAVKGEIKFDSKPQENTAMSRISEERMGKALEQLKSISQEDYAKVKALAAIVKTPRSFIFKTPDAYGLKGWHDLVIPSADGTPLEAWYIPAKGGESDKLVIFNHALPMCRAGFPGHFGEPWSNFDDAEIDFVIQYKHLTDAGYNVLT